jgi:hypothetical protein
MPSERVKHGGTEMNRNALIFTLASVLIACTSTAIACEYKAGETKFVDYANCRYGEDNIQVVKLPEDFRWGSCVYYLQAFRPPKLLAVTQLQDGKELISINDRSKIGNPCYLTKQYCDTALKAVGQ